MTARTLTSAVGTSNSPLEKVERCCCRRGYAAAPWGFTLLELIVVIFLVSLLAGLVFPSFYGARGKGLLSEARRIASLLRYLNERAIATKETGSLKCDLGERTFSWKEEEGERTDRFQTLEGLSLPSKGEVKEGEVIVFFGPAGIQESIEVHLREEERRMVVALNPASGRVKISLEGS